MSLLLLGSVSFAVVLLIDTPNTPVIIVVLSLIAFIPLTTAGTIKMVLISIRPLLRLTDDAVVVRNPYERTRRIPLVEIMDVSAGYSGIEITTTRGTTVVAEAVQKSNLAQWLGRQTRADMVTRKLGDAVAAAQAESSNNASGGSTPAPE
ncbi:PH domain-containing protein [Streptosporangium amethystogenes]|uniref:PH domain-containing protein n=1 Tax=Streptosporangium amethystogenes TaxID=2002 RepID=UPI0004C7968E|nr:PH domain-containing protein [Streptosporangium amethystogenes]